MSLVGFVEQSLLVIFLSRNFTKAPADPSYPCVVGRKNDGEGFKRFVFRMMCLKNVFCFQLAKNGGINKYIYIKLQIFISYTYQASIKRTSYYIPVPMSCGMGANSIALHLGWGNPLLGLLRFSRSISECYVSGSRMVRMTSRAR